MQDYHIPLLPGGEYHILSRAIGAEKLFREKKNYHFFLGRYRQYISPVSDTYSYSLLPNHFHFFVRIKQAEIIEEYFGVKKKGKTCSPDIVSEFIMECFSNLLNSYTKSINKIYDRKGSLFIDYLRRVEITSEEQFNAAVFYIHKNPVHHGYCKKMDEWEWSSYNAMITDKPTWLLRENVLERFGGRQAFFGLS